MKHTLNRTSPKGGEFLGTCFLCGKEGLPITAVMEDCENVRGLTQDEALIEAISNETANPPSCDRDKLICPYAKWADAEIKKLRSHQ